MISETTHRKKVSTLVSAVHQSCPMTESELHMELKTSNEHKRTKVPQHDLGNGMRRKACESEEKEKVQRKTARFRPTVPRSLLRSVGRLNFLPGPLTETKETGKKEVINPLN